VDNLFSAGYTPGNLVDILLVIGDKVITNYLYSVSKIHRLPGDPGTEVPECRSCARSTGQHPNQQGYMKYHLLGNTGLKVSEICSVP
jgi:hypothetical protein